MIEYALLIMLGFCVGGLIAFLLAPTLWHRAVRLTTKRLEATLPMSLSDIEADKDLLRASYAIRIRRLEAGLGKARDKSANQLVEISRLQMQIGELEDQIAALGIQLDERRNAASVFENTIRKRFPELENAVAAAKAGLENRSYEINDVMGKLRRREEALALAQRSATLQQQEIQKLREALEKTGSDATGRFKRRPSQWTLDEYRSEYDRLNVEMSKMREQLVVGHEREASQIAVLRTELQQLGEQIMNSVAAQERREVANRNPEAEAKPWPGTRAEPAPKAAKRGLSARPAAKAPPWPAEKPKDASAPVPADAKTLRQEPAAPELPAARQTRSRWSDPIMPNRGSAQNAAPKSAERLVDTEGESGAAQAKLDTREALNTLLDRGANRSGRDGAPKSDSHKAGAFSDAAVQDGASTAGKDAAPQTLDVEFEVVADALQGEAVSASDAATVGDALAAASVGPGIDQAEADAQPKLDLVLREIFENRSAAQANAAPPSSAKSPGSADQLAAEEEPVSKLESSRKSPENGTQTGTSADKKRTLLDRLRVMQERQTG